MTRFFPRRFSLKLAGSFCAAALLWQSFSCRSNGAPSIYAPAPPLKNDEALTASREIRDILVDGLAIWVATPGGVLRIEESVTKKFTTRDGLPTNEVRTLEKTGDKDSSIMALTPRGAVRFDGMRWQPAEAKGKARPAALTAETSWRGGVVEASIGALTWEKNGKKQPIPWPASPGSHVSALLPRGDGDKALLWAALFGDGLWTYDGRQWSRPAPGFAQAAPAKETISLAEQDGHLIIGTRRDGLWRETEGQWVSLGGDLRNEPFDHNVQAMQPFKGALYSSTLEDGLQVRAGDGWHHVLAEMSSNAPRQLVEFGGELFVRHGGGKVDKFDGRAWTKDNFAKLPRKKVLAIGGDKRTLYLGQWGGWSEWDGRTLTHHLNLPELQGIPPMALLADDKTLWFATQSRGIAEVERATGKIRWHDERLGLPDDWVTCLYKIKDQMFAGTFVGGLALWDGKQWQATPEIKDENVTALDSDGAGGLYIATRHGVWQRTADGKMAPLRQRVPWVESEAQALYSSPDGLWVGTRTGIFFVKETLADTANGKQTTKVTELAGKSAIQIP